MKHKKIPRLGKITSALIASVATVAVSVAMPIATENGLPKADAAERMNLLNREMKDYFGATPSDYGNNPFDVMNGSPLGSDYFEYYYETGRSDFIDPDNYTNANSYECDYGRYEVAEGCRLSDRKDRGDESKKVFLYDKTSGRTVDFGDLSESDKNKDFVYVAQLNNFFRSTRGDRLAGAFSNADDVKDRRVRMGLSHTSLQDNHSSLAERGNENSRIRPGLTTDKQHGSGTFKYNLVARNKRTNKEYVFADALITDKIPNDHGLRSSQMTINGRFGGRIRTIFKAECEAIKEIPELKEKYGNVLNLHDGFDGFKPKTRTINCDDYVGVRAYRLIPGSDYSGSARSRSAHIVLQNVRNSPAHRDLERLYDNSSCSGSECAYTVENATLRPDLASSFKNGDDKNINDYTIGECEHGSSTYKNNYVCIKRKTSSGRVSQRNAGSMEAFSRYSYYNQDKTNRFPVQFPVKYNPYVFTDNKEAGRQSKRVNIYSDDQKRWKSGALTYSQAYRTNDYGSVEVITKPRDSDKHTISAERKNVIQGKTSKKIDKPSVSPNTNVLFADVPLDRDFSNEESKRFNRSGFAGLFTSKMDSDRNGIELKKDGSFENLRVKSDAPLGNFDYKMYALYPDGSYSKFNRPLNVAPPTHASDDVNFDKSVCDEQNASPDENGNCSARDESHFLRCEGVPENDPWFKVNGETCGFTSDAPTTVYPGIYNNKIKFIYDDDSSNIRTVPVKVNTPLKDYYAPSYTTVDIKRASEEKGIEAPGFSPALKNPDDVKRYESKTSGFTVDESTGSVNSHRFDENAELGEYPIQVEVTYKDDSKEIVNANFNIVKGDNNVEVNPVYEEFEAQQTKTTKSAIQNGDRDPIPAGTSYKKLTGPEWLTVDPSTGELTAKPSREIPLEDFNFSVEVTYPDSTKDTISSKITVLKFNDNEEYPASYEDIMIKRGKPFSSFPAEFNPAYPDTARFEFVGEKPPFVTSINESNGMISGESNLSHDTGDYSVPVKVTYQDGTSNNIALNIKLVAGEGSYEYEPVYASAETKQNSPVKLSAPKSRGKALPAGTKYSAEGNNPGFVTINPDGTIDVAPGLNDEPGNYTARVRITYPDLSSDIVEIPVTVEKLEESSAYVPSYEKMNVRRGEQATSKPVQFTPVYSGGATFSFKDQQASWIKSIDDKTGAITVLPDLAVQPGDYSVVVRVRYADGTEKEVTEVIKVVPGSSEYEIDPQYTEVSMRQGTEAVINAPVSISDTQVPEGTQYKMEEGAPSWAHLNEDGSITLSPDYGVSPGEFRVPVTLTYPDKTSDRTEAIVRIERQTDSVRYNPTYRTLPVTQSDDGSGKGSTEIVNSGDPLPIGTSFAFGDNVPDYMTIDKDTGKVEANPNFKVPAGNKTFPVIVTYPDGTQETLNLNVNVKKGDDSDRYAPEVEAVEVEQDSETVSKAPVNSNDNGPLPEGTKFSGDSSNAPWMKVNEDGTLTVNPDLDVEAGDYVAKIIVTYPDSSTETIEVPVKITKASDAKTYSAEYGSVSVAIGESNTLGAPKSLGKDLPEGTIFEPGQRFPDWARVNKDGSVDVSPNSGVKIGDHIFGVALEYPDGTRENIAAYVTVLAPRSTANQFDPAYGAGIEVVQGEQGVIEAPENSGRENLPEKTRFVLNPSAPDWAHVNTKTGEIKVRPDFKVDPVNYEIPVDVFYPDNSKQTINAHVRVLRADFSKIAEFTYGDAIDVRRGESFVINPPTANGKSAPANTRFDAQAGFPEWAMVDNSGKIRGTVPENIEFGKISLPVKLTFFDGSDQISEALVSVNDAPMNEKFDPSYPGGTKIKQGEEKTIDSPFVEGVPEGTKFEIPESTPDWITIADDGSIKINPPEDVKPGDYNVDVKVTYSDGTVDTVSVPFIVEKKEKVIENHPEISVEITFIRPKKVRAEDMNRDNLATRMLTPNDLVEIEKAQKNEKSNLIEQAPVRVIETPDDNAQAQSKNVQSNSAPVEAKKIEK